MNTSTRAADLRGSRTGAFTKKRQAGTSLVEILVVIVIFLIGILAVVQIFPGGFRLLLVSRNNSVATALGREEIERLKDRADLLPEAILAVRYVNGNLVVDPTLNPTALGPEGTSNLAIDVNGGLTDDSDSNPKDWALNSGANVARRIIGEGYRVPVPRQVGTGLYGGLLLLEHGPRDPKGVLAAYANDLTRTAGAPLSATSPGTVNVQIGTATGGSATVSMPTVATPAATAPFEYFVENASNANAALYLPAALYPHTYRLRFAGYVNNGSGYDRIDFIGIPISVPAFTAAAIQATPLVKIDFTSIVTTYRGAAGPVGSVEIDTVRLAPAFVDIGTTAAWSGDPFEMRVVDPSLGVLVFSPNAREAAVARPGGVNQPLVAKIDYDVLDWRILREDFRVLNDNAAFRLALQSLKVGSSGGPDGRVNSGLIRGGSLLDPSPASLGDGNYPRDNVAVIDLATGFSVQEYLTDDKDTATHTKVDLPGNDPSLVLVAVDKSRGVVTLKDADLSTPGIQIRLVPPSGAPIMVNAENRTFRVLYKARQEWSVQLVKGASQYAILEPTGSTAAGTPAQGQCAYGVSGGTSTRIYFPRSDAGRKVTIDTIIYQWGDGSVHTLEGQDFVISYLTPNTTNLPCVDVASVDPSATTLASSYGEAVRGVKGASVAVRVLWNPDQFKLTSDSANNMSLVDQWARSWRKSTTDTYLRAEETR